MPSRIRFSRRALVFSVINSKSEIWSVSTRLISSGIARVEAAQTRLDVDHCNAFLDRNQRRMPAWNSRRPLPALRAGCSRSRTGSKASHDFGCLHCMRCRTHLEIDIGGPVIASARKY